MEITEFAHQVLRGTSLADKLHRPPQLVDLRPRAGKIPAAPGRPSQLALVQSSTQSQAFPTQGSLQDPKMRGLAFHFFANHELLALELMAVALLKFPDAPAKFRRQVATAMLEEQEHLAAYLAHMPGYGVEFGQVPVSPFFWNVLHTMESPCAYVAGMSLTFEQANLDFALRFRDAFAKVGDAQGAAVLQKVLDDEIGHVRLGLSWSRKLDPAHANDFERHKAHLRWPLHLGRAKGAKLPHLAPRLAAGFSREYVDALGCVRISKGRAPTLWVFNPGFEQELAGNLHGAAGTKIESDLGFLLSYLGSQDDIVGVTQTPRLGFLKPLIDLGWVETGFAKVPAWPRPWPKDALAPHKLASIQVWGQSRAASQALSHAQRQSVRAAPCGAQLDAACQLSNKSYAADLWSRFAQSLEPALAARLASPGQRVRDLSALERQVAQQSARSGVVVLKAPLGTAGRNMCLVQGSTLAVAQQNWARKILDRQGEILLEPWATRVADLSARYGPFDAQGSRRTRSGCTRMLCDGRGRFMGHVLAPLGQGLDRALLEFVYGRGQDARWIPKLFDRFVAFVAQDPAACAYKGPLGIDAYVAASAQGLCLRPVTEINARYTMGHVADALSKKVSRSAVALWLHLGLREVQAAGFDSFAQAARALPTQLQGSAPPFAKGRVWTTDPQTARWVATVLVIDASPDKALAQLGPLAGVIAQKIAGGSGDFLRVLGPAPGTPDKA